MTPDDAYRILYRLYRDAFRCYPDCQQTVLDWAGKPELWAEHQIRYRNWSFQAAEAVVRQCRNLHSLASTSSGADPFDPNWPIAEPAQ